MKRFNLALILGFVLAVALAAPDMASAAPKKKAAPKAKVAAAKKKAAPRAPASGKKAKSAPGKKAPKAIAKKGAPKKVTKGKALAKATKAQAKAPAKAPAPSPSLFEATPKERLPTGMAGLGLGSTAGALNSNKSFEIRGQARTLSMMLILRNGKENVNFVKVRQDYATEIAKTEF